MGLEKVGCNLLKGDNHPLSEETDENQEDRKNIEAGTSVYSVQFYYLYATLSVCLLLPPVSLAIGWQALAHEIAVTNSGVRREASVLWGWGNASWRSISSRYSSGFCCLGAPESALFPVAALVASIGRSPVNVLCPSKYYGG